MTEFRNSNKYDIHRTAECLTNDTSMQRSIKKRNSNDTDKM